MITYNKQTGTMIITQMTSNGQPVNFELEIMQQGNCLAVFTYNNGETRTLYNFWMDEAHIKNIKKSTGGIWLDQIQSIKLNIFYKEALKLAKIFAKYGYEVTIYYKPENK